MQKIKRTFMLALLSISFFSESNHSSILSLVEELSKVKTEEQAQVIKENLREHPDFYKSLSLITKKDENKPYHDAIYVKFYIFNYLRNREYTQGLSKENSDIIQRFDRLHSSADFYKQYTDCHNDNSKTQVAVGPFNLKHYWTPRTNINGGLPLSKEKFSPSRCFADSVHQGLLNCCNYQINKNAAPEDRDHKLSVADLLKIAETCKQKADRDWRALDEELSEVEKKGFASR